MGKRDLNRLFCAACIATVLSACAYLQPLPPLAYRLCPVEQSTWTLIEAPEIAPALLSMISEQSRPHLQTRASRLYWFQNGDELKLCSAKVSPEPIRHCGARVWDFKDSGEKWILISDLESIYICS